MSQLMFLKKIKCIMYNGIINKIHTGLIVLLYFAFWELRKGLFSGPYPKLPRMYPNFFRVYPNFLSGKGYCTPTFKLLSGALIYPGKLLQAKSIDYFLIPGYLLSLIPGV